MQRAVAFQQAPHDRRPRHLVTHDDGDAAAIVLRCEGPGGHQGRVPGATGFGLKNETDFRMRRGHGGHDLFGHWSDNDQEIPETGRLVDINRAHDRGAVSDRETDLVQAG